MDGMVDWPQGGIVRRPGFVEYVPHVALERDLHRLWQTTVRRDPYSLYMVRYTF